jgi:membrane protein YdbS with pleckstrin-like domain
MTEPDKQLQNTPKPPEVQLPSLTAAAITFFFLFSTTASLILVFAGVLNIYSFIVAMFSIILLMVIAVIFILKATGQIEGQSFENVILSVLKQLTLYDALISKLGDIFGKSKN